MKKLLLYALPLGLIISLVTLFNNNNSYSQQTSTVKTTTVSKQTSHASSVKSLEQNDNDDNIDNDDNDSNEVNITSSHHQVSTNSSNIQRNSLSVDAANLKRPYILKINSLNAKLQGEIKINGRVVRRLNKNQSQINLSPYLSRGRQKVEVSGRYTPANASVSIEMNSDESNISQATSGNGILNYTLDLNVQ